MALPDAVIAEVVDFAECVQDELENRVLQFDADAGTQAAQIAAERKARGRPEDMRDIFIAGIALARRATLATCNTRHFDDLSVRVVNPWQTVSENGPSLKTKASNT